jgi:hypothetical protein
VESLPAFLLHAIHAPAPKMEAYVYFDIFCFLCFCAMSVIFALGTLSGFARSRDILDKTISLVIGGFCAYGFAVNACDTLARLRA